MDFKVLKVISKGLLHNTYVEVDGQPIGGVTKIELVPISTENHIFTLKLELEDFEMNVDCHPFREGGKAQAR